MSYVAHITRGGVVIVDAATIGGTVGGAVTDGTLVRLARDGADNAAPILGGVPDAQLFGELFQDAVAGDINAYTRDSFAAVLGTLAGLLTLPLGPIAALAIDQAASEAFKRAYDAAGDISRRMDWVPLFDLIDDLLDRKLPGFDDGINLGVNGCYRAARAWTRPVDPLMLDLDGDGLELSAANGSVLFDHDADGVRTGTGWIGRDDGILVRDVDGNGTIDSGRELFGVETIKANGQKAINGFDALKDLDSNADGNFTSADVAWSQVKVWRDLDQDGVSDAGELFGLVDLGISRIGVVGSATAGQAGTTVNGNFIAQGATFTQDGLVHTVGSVDLAAGAIDLANNPFYREFTDEIPLTEQAKALPNMQGSGRVRDLDEAMSLSPELAAKVAAFATITTRDGQRTQLDELMVEWAQSSDYWASLEDVLGLNVIITGLPAGMTSEQYRQMVSVLEVFNGERFYNTGANGASLTAGTTRTYAPDPTSGVMVMGFTLTPPAAQLALLQQSYDALKESVYGALVVQTRLKPYLDSIELILDEDGMSFDTSVMTTMLENNKVLDERNALLDLVELNRYASNTLTAAGFHGVEKLRQWVQDLPGGSPLLTELTALNVLTAVAATGTGNSDIYLGNASANSFNAGVGDDIVSGGGANDTLWGGDGTDALNGDEGNDSLYGGNGDDTLDGGAGNDLLVGGNDSGGSWNGSNYYSGQGNDTYRFGRGDGQDTVWDADGTAGNQDTIALKDGVAPSEVRITRPAGTNNLVLSIVGTTDTLTVGNFFVGDGSGGYAIEQVSFADGTVWDLAAIKARALLSTAGVDDITGYASDDTINAGDGNDRVWANGGNDAVQAGAGADQVWGQDGNDVLEGQEGNDTVFGGAGNDVIDGGAGNDLLVGGNDSGGSWNGSNYYNGQGNDTYRFGRGDGQDTVWDADGTAGNQDTIALKDGVAPSEVRITRPAGTNNLVLSIVGTTDTLTVGNFFVGDGSGGYAIEQVSFADGTVWDLAAIKARALLSTAGVDDITGYASDDTINAGDGNDRVWANGGNDAVQAGAGADQVWGQDGNDVLEGQEGNDTVFGGAGNDVIDGGAGNDLLVGGNDSGGSWNGSNYYSGQGNDTYRFGRGDGQDTVWDADGTAGNQDTIALKDGVAPSEVRITRPAGTNNLVLSIVGTTDTLTVGNFFVGDGSGGYAIEQVSFADGTVWDLAAIKARALLSTAGVDDITGYASDDTINAGDGNDRVWANGGNDAVQAGAGADQVWGQDGNDVLEGQEGNDTVFGGAGNDVIDGGAGNDLLVGGNDSGGSWNGSNYYSGQGNDTYRFGRGDGQDTVWDADGTAGNQDTIALKDGVAPSEVRITRPAGTNNLVLSIVGTTDTLTVGNFFVGDGSGGYAIEQVSFADGTVWDLAAIKARALLSTAGVDDITGYASDDTINAGDGNDRVWANGGNDAVQAGAGADQVWGQDGNDVLEGQEGNDTVFGGAGNDVIDGGAGNDLLVGGNDSGGSWNGSNYYSGQGNDTYRFGRGDGQDTVWDADGTVGNSDMIDFATGVSADQLWFRHVGSNLEVSIVGTDDKVTIANWYSGGTYHVEQFRTSDGRILLDGQVSALVDAMASFAVPAAGQTTLPTDYKASLDPVIATSWTPAGT